jgi:alkaline phosphatase D
VKHSRREFLEAAALAGVSPFFYSVEPLLRLQPSTGDRKVFLHGVASGDPLADRVVLWTRLSGASPGATVEVRWEMATDPAFKQRAAGGRARTGAARDFTVKIDARGLRPARTDYYRFTAGGEQSAVGRTRTLADASTARLRLAFASCANLPAGFFNAYRGIASRSDLDAVVHLGDYYYEYQNARYGDGARLGRIPAPDREVFSLDDYRTRHAQYKTDPDLQEAHRQHPWITVWDDHEFANDTWRDGAANHNPDQGEGEWPARRAAAARAYYEWMPIRDFTSPSEARIYRTFAFGPLMDLVMLDTRVVGRDQQAARDRIEAIEDPKRSLLGAKQEEWLFEQLRDSQKRGARWQVLGQQVMFAPNNPWGRPAGNADAWDGYRPARDRVIDFLEANKMRSTIIMTGDVHSSWAYDVAKDPWGAYDPSTGRGAAAVEFVTPSVTSPSGWNAGNAETRLDGLLKSRPHLKWADGLRHGYIVLDITKEAVQADFFGVPTIDERTPEEHFEKGFTSAAGAPHLVEAAAPASPNRDAPEPAPPPPGSLVPVAAHGHLLAAYGRLAHRSDHVVDAIFRDLDEREAVGDLDGAEIA